MVIAEVTFAAASTAMSQVAELACAGKEIQPWTYPLGLAQGCDWPVTHALCSHAHPE